MSPDPTPTPTSLEAQQAEDAQLYRAVLHDLIDLGVTLARSIQQQAIQTPATEIPATQTPATQTPAAPTTPELAIAFDRVARCVRRTILLARVVTRPLPAPNPETTARAARKRILREVEDTIQRKAAPKAAEVLHAELRERLEAPELAEDLEHEIASRPVDGIIADICRDLGIAALPGTNPWKRRRPKDIVILAARAAHRPPCLRHEPMTPSPIGRGSG